jgi:hypothetical protein
MELFGPDFQNHGKESEESTSAESSSTSTAVGKATKGKVAAKSTGHTYQFQIMDSIGVPRAEIKKFADPYHWLEYFPPIAMVSLLGLCRDLELMSGRVDRSQRLWNTYRLEESFYDHRCQSVL